MKPSIASATSWEADLRIVPGLADRRRSWHRRQGAAWSLAIIGPDDTVVLAHSTSAGAAPGAATGADPDCAYTDASRRVRSLPGRARSRGLRVAELAIIRDPRCGSKGPTEHPSAEARQCRRYRSSCADASPSRSAPTGDPRSISGRTSPARQPPNDDPTS
jgi:hypothetical protein